MNFHAKSLFSGFFFESSPSLFVQNAPLHMKPYFYPPPCHTFLSPPPYDFFGAHVWSYPIPQVFAAKIIMRVDFSSLVTMRATVVIFP